MAINTPNKRRACINYGLPHSRVYPRPDGSLFSHSDRRHLVGNYPGTVGPVNLAGILMTRMSNIVAFLEDEGV